MNAGGPAAHISGGPAIRDPEDLRHVREAQAVLASDLRTDHLGLDLGRRHNTPELLTVPGWKFLRGARIQTGPTIGDNPRKSWPYYIKIVLNIGDDEQGKPLPWEASARPTAPNKAEVRRRELKEGFRRKQELERERGATDGPS